MPSLSLQHDIHLNSEKAKEKKNEKMKTKKKRTNGK